MFLAFLFPEGTHEDDMKISGDGEIKLFCKDYVENATFSFIFATIAAVLVIISLVSKNKPCSKILQGE